MGHKTRIKNIKYNHFSGGEEKRREEKRREEKRREDEHRGTRRFSPKGSQRRRERKRGKSGGHFNAIGVDADRGVRFHERKVCGVWEINQRFMEKGKERIGEKESEGMQRRVDEDYCLEEQQRH